MPATTQKAGVAGKALLAVRGTAKDFLWTSSSHILLLSAALFALGMVGLSMAGGALAWSPVPFWDMWDGYLDFFLHQQDGETGAWWFQQNDHRIVLAKVLFWLDLKWFGGMSVFLIVFNYVLAACAALLFCRMLRQLAGTARATAGEWSAMLFLTAWMFLWSQQENLTWAFQSQFFLAQLLPLCAFYFLSRSEPEAMPGPYFMLAAAFGLACIGSMANGILALPLMLVYAVVARLGRLKMALLATTIAISLSAFFYQYNVLGGHAPIYQVIQDHPLAMLAYSLRYLGGPFYFLAGGTSWGKHLALAAGLLLLIGALYRTCRVLSSPRPGLDLALLFFIIYIALSAVLTASGRLFADPGQVIASRYTTPAVMAWAALGVQFFPLLRARKKAWQTASVLVLCALGAAMLLLQRQALNPPEDVLFGKNIAALALAMGVQDRLQIEQVYPDPLRALALAGKAAEKGLSVFGRYPLQDVSNRMGQPWQETGGRCEGQVMTALPVAGDARYVRVDGILRVQGSSQPPAFVRLVAAGKVAGYAITGAVAMLSESTPAKTRFAGYLRALDLGGELVLQGEQPACLLRTRVPSPLFSVVPGTPSPQLTSVVSANVLPGNNWQGHDFFQSHFNGMQVYGSTVGGDAGKGTISLLLRRGDRFFYRSGPNAGRQILEIQGHPELRMAMPVMTEWTQLVFDTAALPAQDMVISMTDNGSDWGEWSALALKAE